MASIPIVVIGASAGGVEALARLVRDLPADFPGAIFVTLHFPSYGTSVMPRILERAGKLKAKHPDDGERFAAGHIYVAPPDKHLIIHRKRIRTVRGPRENGNRPAIDPMFRSAAVFHEGMVVGVVLTGNLDDGTAGLVAIKRRGGTAIIQEPADALFPSMPTSAAEHVDADWVLPLEQIGAKINAVVEQLATVRAAAGPSDVREDEMADDRREMEYDEINLSVIEEVQQHPGRPSQFGCPDCGGVLWEIQDGELLRFRCRVGHAWSADALVARQMEQLDSALWVALRALEESASLNQKMAERARKRGNEILAAKFDRDARTIERRVGVIRDAIVAGSAAGKPPAAEKAEGAG